MLNYADGDLIKMAKNGDFDLIAHGANCFCVMGGGIARQIHKEIPEAYAADCQTVKGDINKLGNYTSAEITTDTNVVGVLILNCYTQYGFTGYDKNSPPVDYEAIALCMRKINHNFKGKHIGLPLIGSGLAGGDWDRIEDIIYRELVDMDVTIVKFIPPVVTPAFKPTPGKLF